jgi:hypothetical protein
MNFLSVDIVLEEARRHRESIEALTTEQIKGNIAFLDCERLRKFYTSYLGELRDELQRRVA